MAGSLRPLAPAGCAVGRARRPGATCRRRAACAASGWCRRTRPCSCTPSRSAAECARADARLRASPPGTTRGAARPASPGRSSDAPAPARPVRGAAARARAGRRPGRRARRAPARRADARPRLRAPSSGSCEILRDLAARGHDRRARHPRRRARRRGRRPGRRPRRRRGRRRRARPRRAGRLAGVRPAGRQDRCTPSPASPSPRSPRRWSRRRERSLTGVAGRMPLRVARCDSLAAVSRWPGHVVGLVAFGWPFLASPGLGARPRQRRAVALRRC